MSELFPLGDGVALARRGAEVQQPGRRVWESSLSFRDEPSLKSDFLGLFRQGCYRSTRFRFLLFTIFLSYLSFLLLMMFSGGRTLLKTRYYSFFSSFRALSSNNIDR